jgi:hypothetical protein
VLIALPNRAVAWLRDKPPASAYSTNRRRKSNEHADPSQHRKSNINARSECMNKHQFVRLRRPEKQELRRFLPIQEKFYDLSFQTLV